jgi:hypothetical protein
MMSSSRSIYAVIDKTDDGRWSLSFTRVDSSTSESIYDLAFALYEGRDDRVVDLFEKVCTRTDSIKKFETIDVESDAFYKMSRFTPSLSVFFEGYGDNYFIYADTCNYLPEGNGSKRYFTSRDECLDFVSKTASSGDISIVMDKSEGSYRERFWFYSGSKPFDFAEFVYPDNSVPVTISAGKWASAESRELAMFYYNRTL